MANNRLSVATIDSPEFVNIEKMSNPLISKCEIKVLYVGENRNRSYISKEVATEMAQTLPGCPIVGYFIENKEDFGDHGDQVIIDGEGVKFKTLTKPYGFVAPDSKVWFQKFNDTDEFGNITTREYLMTEGYLWTGQYEEAKRVMNYGNPQSMELDKDTLKGHWSTDNNKGIDFFIINDAIFSKLCILGEDVEPCFEGANVTSPNISTEFSKDDNFTKSLFNMIKELKYTLQNNEGGTPMHNEIQNGLDNLDETTSFENHDNVEAPIVEFEDSESGATDSQDSDDSASTTSDASADDDAVSVLSDEDAEDDDEEEEETERLANDTDVSIKKKSEFAKEEDKEEKSDSKKNEDNTEDDEKESDKEEDKKKKEDEEFACGDKKKYSLEEELSELKIQFAALQEENAKLLAFKQNVEEKEKDELINSFYMLSDEDKKDVIANKANYSLKEIKAELSMICVDKRVSFVEPTSEKETISNEASITTFNLDAHDSNDLPAWLQAVKDHKRM